VAELGPERAKGDRGKRLLRPPADAAAPAPRATPEIDSGRRGGDVFGAFRPAAGDARTTPYDRRTSAHVVDSLGAVGRWRGPAGGAPVYRILDTLRIHHAPDVPLFAARHPTWAFAYQPVYAAWRTLREPWWKALRSRALKGRRFASWDAICAAVRDATVSWNAHRHPSVWGRRRRHRPRPKPGIALGANVRPT
jgi:hypothetical protein